MLLYIVQLKIYEFLLNFFLWDIIYIYIYKIVNRTIVEFWSKERFAREFKIRRFPASFARIDSWRGWNF